MVAQTDITNPSRRAALGALASVPALAILPAIAAASPSSTARLSALIEAHLVAEDALVDADEARMVLADQDVRASFLGRKLHPLGNTRTELTENIDLLFQSEINKIDTLLRLSPELGEPVRAMLETGRTDCLAQIDAAYADHDAAESAVREAEKVCNEALLAVCGHRCASPEEIAIKLRYLAGLGGGLDPDQSVAFYKSLLPEGEDIAAV